MFDELRRVVAHLKDERGQDLSEYALLLGLIALVVIVGVTALGSEIGVLFNDMSTEVGTWF